MSDILFGWDLIYKLSESDLHKKEDVITLLIHFLLIKSGFKCAGIGDSKELAENEPLSESLPGGWSQSDSYSLRYVADKKLYILNRVSVNNSIVYNLLEPSTLDVTNAAFSPDDVVAQIKGSLEEIFPKHKDIIDQIRTQLIAPVKSRNAAEVETQTREEPRSSLGESPSSLRVIPPVIDPLDPLWGSNLRDPLNDPLRDPLRIGGADLNPFGVGGGMIFNPYDPSRSTDPSLPSGLPRGSVPPGARFDPFGPGGIGGPNRPQPRRPPNNPDAFHPPGWPGGPGHMYM